MTFLIHAISSCGPKFSQAKQFVKNHPIKAAVGAAAAVALGAYAIPAVSAYIAEACAAPAIPIFLGSQMLGRFFSKTPDPTLCQKAIESVSSVLATDIVPSVIIGAIAGMSSGYLLRNIFLALGSYKKEKTLARDFDPIFRDRIERTPAPIYDFITHGTLLHALDNKRLEWERQENDKLTLGEQIKKGFISGIVGMVESVVLFSSIAKIGNLFFHATSASRSATNFEAIVAGPALEEMSFRGYIQECIPGSPVFKVLLSNDLFAAVHWLNPGNPLLQCMNILLFPRLSILYQTTGSLVVPLVSHMTNNVVATAYIAAHTFSRDLFSL
ncbi:MAG TPA: CPBP family intramembrane glutamic endopeptidase [Chlamydiales bacterium]|nr:CPBP family intramembrane glutamic endopeptidase [Chlamydiales bacterium]